MKKKYYLFTAIAATSIFIACEDKNDDPISPNPTEETDQEYVNKWMYTQMDSFYLWNDKLPAKDKLNFTIDPYDFFDELLYISDRFSYMEGTHVNIPKSTRASGYIGFEYVPVNSDKGIVNIVTYVKKGTNAELQKLKRGYIITSVDGKSINEDNWFSILQQNKSSYKLKYAINSTAFFEDKLVENTIDVTTDYNDSPIFLDSIYTVGDRKIGYIVYTSYDSGPLATLPYDVELAKKLTRFKQEGIRDLIVDLRYNGGGLVRSAQFLTSALVPNRNTDNIFEVKTYNNDLQKALNKLPNNSPIKQSWMYEYFEDNIINNDDNKLYTIPKLGDQLDNICFLVTRYTASASELTINSLNPYMKEASKNVYIIGETTRGKNVGMWAMYKNNDSRNTYVLWPITFQSHNKLYFTNESESSNYENGFTPDPELEADDFGMIRTGLKDLGDKDETLLNTAISKLTGSVFLKTKSALLQEFVPMGKSSLDRKNKGGHMYLEKEDIKKLKSLEQ